MNRRGFLGTCLALAAAPAIARASSLMPVRAALPVGPRLGDVWFDTDRNRLLELIRQLDAADVGSSDRWLVVHPDNLPMLEALDLRPGKVFTESRAVIVPVRNLTLTLVGMGGGGGCQASPQSKLDSWLQSPMGGNRKARRSRLFL